MVVEVQFDSQILVGGLRRLMFEFFCLRIHRKKKIQTHFTVGSLV